MQDTRADRRIDEQSMIYPQILMQIDYIFRQRNRQGSFLRNMRFRYCLSRELFQIFLENLWLFNIKFEIVSPGNSININLNNMNMNLNISLFFIINQLIINITNIINSKSYNITCLIARGLRIYLPFVIIGKSFLL